MEKLMDYAPYMLTRSMAAKRYGFTLRGFEEFYKHHPEFPLVRVSRKKLLVHRGKADEYFDRLTEEQMD